MAIADRRKFTRETPQKRRIALIEATLELIAEEGLRGATVRAIAERSNVTQGLIRHYFSSKQELILAAYEHHMDEMTAHTLSSVSGNRGSARSQLAAFVNAALTPPVTDARAVGLWASFFTRVPSDQQMRAAHERTYARFRNHLEQRIAAALREDARLVPPRQLQDLAVACNAVIDGLWLEGGALPDAFEPGSLARVGLRSVSAIIGLELEHP